MKKQIIQITFLVSAMLLINTATQSFASPKKKEFVIVPKFVHPFFERTHQGCKEAAKKLNVSCRYQPPQTFDQAEQAKIISDLLTQDIAGLAVAPISSAAVARIIKNSNSKNIPIVTFDSDFKVNDHKHRKTYIGSDNKKIGIELGKLLVKLHPKGGSIAIQAGEPPAENLRERLAGLRSVLDKNKWKEVPGSPFYCNADSQVAVQQLEDLLNQHNDLTAFVALGAWPQVAKRGYQKVVSQHIERVKNNELVLLVADTLKMQMELLSTGYGQGLVGQRPFEMGFQAIKVLNEITKGKIPADPIYTGLDICTKENIDTCLKEASS